MEDKEHTAILVAGFILLFGVLSAFGVSSADELVTGSAVSSSFVYAGLQVVAFVGLFLLVIVVGSSFLFHHSRRHEDVDSIIEKYTK